jgi:hypothetical protein
MINNSLVKKKKVHIMYTYNNNFKYKIGSIGIHDKNIIMYSVFKRYNFVIFIFKYISFARTRLVYNYYKMHSIY